MESDTSNSEETTDGSSDNNINNTMVANSNLVSNNTTNITVMSKKNSSRYSPPSSWTRSKHANQESPLVPAIQQRFITWCCSKNVNAYDSKGINMINFLAHGKQYLNWSTQTIKNYHSSLLDLFDGHQPILDSWSYKIFFQSLDECTLRTTSTTNLNISPVLQHFHQLGNNTKLLAADLTAILCWLLAIYGFLRPSDIERIDVNQCGIDDASNKLTLIIISLKEKRQGQRITKSVVIDRHPSVLFCPVACYSTYLQRIASQPCIDRHPVLSEHSINYLIHDLCDPKQHIGSQRIGKHINSIMDLIPLLPGQKRHAKARAMGSTRAAKAGATTDNIVAHGS
ncbi:hypothetical protein BDA99DRAFT_563804 [Phascolomyces articulosus]|uniref:Uncharacterized protein n=1 Tax=Phascolomyces articulosus TaxID=60185 RepID=A0AAD5PB86_9FUNG|nr:hypothetical protein BDA99DRAFT_563804 [Phascolomyces articulosus]